MYADAGARQFMILWTVGTAVLAIWFVFGDPRFDYRTLIVGAVIPIVVDLPTGGAWVMHSIVASVVLLAVVMLVTIGRRPQRKALLGLPLGTFLYLVSSGAWADQGAFWWPLTGWGASGAPLPFVARSWWNIPLEIAGAAMLAWVVRTTGLTTPERRRQFVRTGHLTLPPSVSEDSRC